MFSFMFPLVLALLERLVIAVPTNFTIDDSYGINGIPGSAPSYSNSSTWRVRNADENCNECSLNPDFNLMSNKTWHDTTTFFGDAQPGRLWFNFTGTAIYIACALAGQRPGALIETHLLFFVDGQHSGEFHHVPTLETPEFLYNVMVFSKTDLTDSNHAIMIVNRQDIQPGSLLLFDYARFTAEVNVNDDVDPPSDDPNVGQPGPSSSLHRKVNPAMIAVGVSIGILVFLVLAGLVWLLTRRLRARLEQKTYAMKRNTSLLMSAIRNPGEPSIAGDPPWK
ncbi:hypothetical protein BKA62DRAFT_641708 [Auriculariales sp. MPI-PUGE-AT-0066]|nr:hypothetical protein BKA62DRAFT_641708 [Auriculariales sp. MPI-PUGE-AT-0066]